MLIAIIGENCAGKSTLASAIQRETGTEIISGKDYLRMAKSEAEARALFQRKLESALNGPDVIYVISETEQLSLLPDGATRILVYADLETIKARFAARMGGNLPEPVALMLENKHGAFDSGTYDYRFDGASGDPSALCEAIKQWKGKRQ